MAPNSRPPAWPRPDRAGTSRAPGSTVHQPAITLRSGDSSPLNADCAVTANTAVGKEAEAHADQRTQRGRRTGLAELADPGFEQAVNHLGFFRFAFFGAGLEVGFGLVAVIGLLLECSRSVTERERRAGLACSAPCPPPPAKSRRRLLLYLRRTRQPVTPLQHLRGDRGLDAAEDHRPCQAEGAGWPAVVGKGGAVGAFAGGGGVSPDTNSPVDCLCLANAWGRWPQARSQPVTRWPRPRTSAAKVCD